MGRMSRQSATHPANAAISPVSVEPNLTTMTNTAGGTAGLVTGEPLTTGTPAPVLVSGAAPPQTNTIVSRPPVRTLPVSNARVSSIIGAPSLPVRSKTGGGSPKRYSEL